MKTGEEFLKTTFREREIKKLAMVTEKIQRCERTTVMNLQFQISQGEKQWKKETVVESVIDTFSRAGIQKLKIRKISVTLKKEISVQQMIVTDK